MSLSLNLKITTTSKGPWGLGSSQSMRVSAVRSERVDTTQNSQCVRGSAPDTVQSLTATIKALKNVSIHSSTRRSAFRLSGALAYRLSRASAVNHRRAPGSVQALSPQARGM